MIKVELRALEGDNVITEALGFPCICSPLPLAVEVDRYPHLQGLDLADVNNCESDSTTSKAIDILIGSDYYWEVVTGSAIRGGSGLVAVSSKFGWLLPRPVCTNINRDNYVVSNMIIEGTDVGKAALYEPVDLVQALHRFWDVEVIGINEASPGENVDSFPMSITFDWNQVRYCIRLPWKSDIRPQIDAFHLCVGRLYQLQNRLKKDKSLLQEYDAVFQIQLSDGIIERVPAHEEKSKPRYFIPHHGVVRADKETTRLRVNFDGSTKAKQGDFSLNECLEKGPNMTPHIFDILLRFRSHQVGIIADIEKAFHQIAIDERDREFLRFLWFDNITNNMPAVTQYRFTRLVFGLTPSPAILNGIIQTHLTRYLLTEPTLSKQLAEGFYVDDFTGGAESVEEAFTI